MQAAGRIISLLLHPLLMPAFGLMLLFYLPTVPISFKKLDALFFFPEEVKMIFFVVLSVLTLLAPGLSIVIMKSTGMISSLELRNRADRTGPYVLVLFYFALAFVYLRFQIPEYLQHPALLSFVFGIFLAVFIAFIINLAGIMISLHAVGAFGLCGGMLAYNQSQLPLSVDETFTNAPVLALLMILAGLVCSARMYLGAHNLKETIIGITVGFITLFTCVKFTLFY